MVTRTSVEANTPAWWGRAAAQMDRTRSDRVTSPNKLPRYASIAAMPVASSYPGSWAFSIADLTPVYSDGTNWLLAAQVAGNIATATKLVTGRTIAITGDVSYTSPSFDGSTNITAAGTIAAGAVTLAKMANLAANSFIGNNGGLAATPLALTVAQAKALLAISTSDVSGLGTSATVNTGTSGALIPLLSGANAWGNTQTLVTGTATVAPLKFGAGANLTAAAAGAVEWNGTNLFITQTTGPTRKQLAFIDDALTGSAAKWTTGRTISLTSDVTGTSAAFDGTANLSFSATIAAASVTLAKMANLAASSFIGNNTAGSATPLALTTTQAKALLAIANTDVSGLGTASTVNTGTSGATIPLLNGANTWAARQTYSVGVVTTPTTFAGLPASPVDGQIGFITDSNTVVFQAAAAGGGTNHVPVHYNGALAAWRVG